MQMARVIGNPFGELRGKLAGNVFSRTKAGAIVREYVKPTNRNSIGQVNARANFGSASMGYATLTESQKSAWNGFASDLARFNPVKGVNNGQYSGFQAFQSLKMVIDSNLASDWTVMMYESYAPTQSPLFFGGYPPDFPLTGDVRWTPEGDVATLNVALIQVTNGAARMHIMPSSMPPNFTAERELRDSNGNLFGFKVYMSSPIFGGQTRPKVELQNVILDTGTLTFPAITPAPTDSYLRFDWDIPTQSLTDNRPGNRVYTVFSVGSLGNMKRIGSIIGRFTPPV